MRFRVPCLPGLVAFAILLAACSSSHASSRASATTARHTSVSFSASGPGERAAYQLCDTFQRKHFPHDTVDAASGPNSTESHTACDITTPATPCPYRSKDGTPTLAPTIYEFYLRSDGSVADAVRPFRECPPKALPIREPVAKGQQRCTAVLAWRYPHDRVWFEDAWSDGSVECIVEYGRMVLCPSVSGWPQIYLTVANNGTTTVDQTTNGPSCAHPNYGPTP